MVNSLTYKEHSESNSPLRKKRNFTIGSAKLIKHGDHYHSPAEMEKILNMDLKSDPSNFDN